ncbi:MAG TPA: MFS transporter [Gaiellaceae bacterium]|nr:MFS transporter [Gaiellaceae bacterium]
MTFSVRRGRTFVSLRKHRNYRLLFMGQVVSVTGTWMQDTALPWLVLRLTHSPIDVGLLVFCRYVPFALLGLPAGALADRFDNRRMMIATQSSSMCVAAALAALTLTGHEQLWALYLLATLGGATTILDAPNRHALTYRLVGRDELPNAVALNSSFFNAGRVVGPAVAGVVIGTLGISVCFVLNALSFLAVLSALLAMRRDELFPLDRSGAAETGGAIREGLRFVLASERTVLLLTIALVVSLTGFNLRVLLPLLAGRTLRAGPETFGVLWASFGTGALAGALYAAGAARASWRTLVAGVGGFSVAMLALAPLHSAAPASVLLAAIGFCFTLWTASSQSILQLTTPDRLRGRVLSIYLFVLTGLTPAGSLLSAWLASVGGTELAFGLAGACGAAMTALAVVRLRPGRVRALARRLATALSPD